MIEAANTRKPTQQHKFIFAHHVGEMNGLSACPTTSHVHVVRRQKTKTKSKLFLKHEEHGSTERQEEAGKKENTEYMILFVENTFSMKIKRSHQHNTYPPHPSHLPARINTTDHLVSLFGGKTQPNILALPICNKRNTATKKRHIAPLSCSC